MERLVRKWRSGLAFALLAGSVWGVASSSCIIPDTCILVVTSGDDWCRQIIGARMWPSGSDDLAVPVLDENENWPQACVCFNDAEAEILFGMAPADVYAELASEIEQAARDECDVIVPVGWEHNCYDESPDGPMPSLPLQGDHGDCVGDCGYASEPKDGCGDDPNPYECEKLVAGETGGDAETGSGGETGETGRPTIEGAIEWTR